MLLKSYLAPGSHVFSVLYSSVITTLGEERAGLCASRAFVCLACMHYFCLFLFLLVSEVSCGF